MRKVKMWHQELRDQPERVKWLIKNRGMKRKTLKKYLIGWDGQRYTIPVFDAKGEKVVNVRRYDPSKNASAKIIHYTERKGKKTLKYGRPPRLYGVDELTKAQNGARVHITEGEWDKLVISQQGWVAVTGTHGAKTWLDSWTPLFRDKDVVLLYDNDRQGKLWSAKVGKTLLSVANSVKNVMLPLDADGMKDVTDWFVAAELTVEELDKLIEETRPLSPTSSSEEDDLVDADEKALDFVVEKVVTYNSIPKKYVLTINPASRRKDEMEINFDTLINPARFERAFGNYFNRIPLGMPANARAWKRVVNRWLDRSEIIDQPPEASELSALREMLADELRKMPVSEGLPELDRARAVVTPSGDRVFKAVALRRVLNVEIGESVTKHTMCAALRRIGCESKVCKIDGRTVKVWTIPRDLQEDREDQESLFDQ
jgi:hypothetical protein